MEEKNEQLLERTEQTEHVEQLKPKKPKNKRKRNKILAFTLIPLAIVMSFTGGYFSRYLFHSKTANTTLEMITLMERVGYIYDEQTGEKRQITQEEILDAIVSGVLDDYSAYYTKEEYETVNQNAEGNLIGAGISFYDTGEILKVTLNSPAELVGVKSGDVIISMTLNGQKYIFKDSVSAFRNALKELGYNQEIELEVQRQSEFLTFKLAKKAYVASYVLYMDNEKTLNFRTDNDGNLIPVCSDGGMAGLDAQTAYIKLNEFNGGAGEQIEQAFEFMKTRGKTKLIFDLRDNGGGYTDILSEIASYFIYNNGAGESLIAFAEGKKRNEYFFTNGNEFNLDITSIAVLANQNTASASECLIGAMLYYKDRFDSSKLVIEKNALGQARTYGKGIMQTTYGLIGGGALKLTTAKMFLPDKATSIHGVGHVAEGLNAVEKGQALARAIEILV